MPRPADVTSAVAFIIVYNVVIITIPAIIDVIIEVLYIMTICIAPTAFILIYASSC